jgi:hypothetical protein
MLNLKINISTISTNIITIAYSEEYSYRNGISRLEVFDFKTFIVWKLIWVIIWFLGILEVEDMITIFYDVLEEWEFTWLLWEFYYSHLFLPPLTASFKLLPTLNTGNFLAFTTVFSPVFGFLPV